MTHGQAHELLTCAESILLEEAGYVEPPVALRHLYAKAHPFRESALARGCASARAGDTGNLCPYTLHPTPLHPYTPTPLHPIPSSARAYLRTWTPCSKPKEGE